MPSQFTKVILSNSSGGKQILVTGTSSGSATLIHTATSAVITGSNIIAVDEVYLYATNNTTASNVTCSILWGGTTEPDDVVKIILPSQNSRTLIADGKLLQNNLLIQAYSNISNSVVIDGFVNRIQDIGIDPYITTWVQRVVNNGGAVPSLNTQMILSTFYRGLVNSSLFYKMISLNCFVPDSLSASITPLIKSNTDPWTNTNFVAGDLTINGLVGNASNKRLDTGFNPTYGWGDNNNGGMSVYVYTDVSEAGCTLGGGNASGQDTMYTNFSGRSQYDSHYNSAAARIDVAALGAGFYSGNRVSVSDMRLYWGNSTNPIAQQGATNTGAPGTRGIYNLWAFAYDDNISGIQYISKRLSFIAIHYGLTTTETTTLFNLVQAMRVSLGGGFV